MEDVKNLPWTWDKLTGKIIAVGQEQFIDVTMDEAVAEIVIAQHNQGVKIPWTLKVKRYDGLHKLSAQVVQMLMSREMDEELSLAVSYLMDEIQHGAK